MKILLTLLFTFSAQAVTLSYLNMKPNRAYMNFALTEYLRWHGQTYPSSFKRTELMDLLLSRIDHWVVQEKTELPQFWIAHALDEKGTLRQRYRFYIHPDLRAHALVKSPKAIDPWFYEWEQGKPSCYLGRVAGEKEFILHRYCDGKLDRLERLRTDISPTWPDPFPYQKDWELRFEVQGQVREIFYTSDATHPGKVPKGLIPVLGLHGMQALFPFDKYSVDAKGNMTIYFP